MPTEQQLVVRFEEDVRELEARLVQENPGVQGVMDAYAAAQASLQHVDNYTRVVNPQPVIITSNGSGPTA